MQQSRYLRSATRSRPRARRACVVALVATIGLGAAAGSLAAHDFWLVPNAFAVAAGETLAVRGQTSTRFPTSVSAVVPERVADARLLGAAGAERIADLSVEGKSLLLRSRPAAAGQRVVAIALVPRASRTAPQALQRYLALEGAPALAERYAREGRFAGSDSLTQRTTKMAKTLVEVGRGGPRAFARTAGHALEFVPLTDPATARAGDTLAVRLLFRGAPLADAHLHAGSAPEGAAADSASGAGPAAADVALATDAQGVARLPLARAGLWNVRTVHGAPATGAARAWDVYFATLVFQVVGPPRSRRDPLATTRRGGWLHSAARPAVRGSA